MNLLHKLLYEFKPLEVDIIEKNVQYIWNSLGSHNNLDAWLRYSREKGIGINLYWHRDDYLLSDGEFLVKKDKVEFHKGAKFNDIPTLSFSNLYPTDEELDMLFMLQGGDVRPLIKSFTRC